jgi:hypothetical protein
MKILGTILFLFLFIQDASAFAPYYSYSPPGARKTTRSFFTINPYKLKKRGFDTSTPSQQRQKRISLTRTLPTIHSIFIKGGVDLQIIGGQTVNKIAIKKMYRGLSIKMCNTGIFIYNPKPVDCNQNPRPIIRLQLSDELRQLVVAGNSCVRGSNLNTACGMTINNCGNGFICLNGPIRLIRLVNTGNATICIHDVISDHVHILATRNGCNQLTGETGLLLIRAFEKATVDTRFMCSHIAMVQAADQSCVSVKTIGSLQAFADGMSNIYYYALPRQLIQHQAFSGNVFQMGTIQY